MGKTYKDNSRPKEDMPKSPYKKVKHTKMQPYSRTKKY